MIVVAVVPAKDAADRIGATVRATASIPGVTRVLVVDDGSVDDTVGEARRAGAEVLVLPANRGKGGALAAGIAATPDADAFVLLDADLADTAAAAAPLLGPVLDGEADLTIGILPGAGGRGGFGLVRDLARAGIRRAAAIDVAAPLSGQRVVRADLLRQLDLAPRFGVEVGMTIDAVRAGGRVREIEVPLDHAHTGRSIAGFRHRGRQGLDVLGALWPRLTTRRARLGGIGVATVLVVIAMFWSGSQWEPTTAPLGATPDRVVVVGFGPLDFADLDRGFTPTLDQLRDAGASGAMTVRTVARRPSLAEGYLSLGGGARLRAFADADQAVPADQQLEAGTAAEILEAQTGRPATGEIAVIGAPRTVAANRGAEVSSSPGTLAETLAAAGLRSAVVGVSDRQGTLVSAGRDSRPAALAAMDRGLTVATGSIDPGELLVDDPDAPFGVRADRTAVLDAVDAALDDAALVIVDPGDLARAEGAGSTSLAIPAGVARARALADTDALLGELLGRVPPDTLVYVVSVAPPGGTFRLTPVFAVGPGVPAGGWITSPSTKRTGLVALTDLAPTVMAALGAPELGSTPGNPLRYEDGPVDVSRLERFDRETNVRERTYYPQALGFIVVQALLYGIVALAVARRDGRGHPATLLRALVLGVAAYPLATFVVKGIPAATTGPVWVPAALAVGGAALLGAVCARQRRHPLAGLATVLALTVAVIVVDAATGTWLHVSSWLGYSLHSAGRFYGIPNTTFAVLGSATLILAANLVHTSRRRDEALAAVAALFVVVVLADGAPTLGGDVGGIITFVPVFGLTWYALAGRRIRGRTILVAGAATIAVVLVAAGVDLLRPEASRTHLGRFAADLLDDGVGPFIDTFWRKQSANLRILRVSIWTWMLPITAAFTLYLLVWGRLGTTLLPAGSARRVGAVSVTSAALLGFVANDSGPIVIALFFTFLLPQLALLALTTRPGRPVLLGPVPAPPVGGPRS